MLRAMSSERYFRGIDDLCGLGNGFGLGLGGRAGGLMSGMLRSWASAPLVIRPLVTQ
jgi:hypothetical protein